jgi:hypothetical protein
MSAHGLFRVAWILTVLLAGCTPFSRVPDAADPLPSPSGDWTLKLTQSGGFAGVNLVVQVSSDGRLTAEDQRAGRSVSQTLPPEAVAQIAAQVPQGMQSTRVRPNSGCADCFLYRLEFTSGGQTRSLEADDTTLSNSGAAELVRLLQQLRDQALRTAP